MDKRLRFSAILILEILILEILIISDGGNCVWHSEGGGAIKNISGNYGLWRNLSGLLGVVCSRGLPRSGACRFSPPKGRVGRTKSLLRPRDLSLL